MPAPECNEFWKLRSKHGRPALFASPELLWEAACEYFEWCNANPWKEKDWVGKDAEEVFREKTRPYTLSGLCVYCDASRSWWTNFRKDADKDFLTVITRVEEIIYTQKFEGAAVGLFNANIIARDLGLTDSTKVQHDGEISTPNLSHLSYEQLYELKHGCKPE